jgi:hypothetical protein
MFDTWQPVLFYCNPYLVNFFIFWFKMPSVACCVFGLKGLLPGWYCLQYYCSASAAGTKSSCKERLKHVIRVVAAVLVPASDSEMHPRCDKSHQPSLNRMT